MADGKDYNEAIEIVLIVIGEWIETSRLTGQEIPEPKGRPVYA